MGSKKNLTFVAFIVMLNMGCVWEPKSQISSDLMLLNKDKGEHLLRKEVYKLNEWRRTQQKKYDSTHFYIFQNPLVKNLYGHPYSHFKLTQEIISDNTVDVGVKELLIRLSQCVSLKDYLHLGWVVADTDNEELMTVHLSPGSEYGYLLSENYLDMNVVSFLKEIVKKYPSLAGTTELILSGTNIKRINAYKVSGENLPVLKCSN